MTAVRYDCIDRMDSTYSHVNPSAKIHPSVRIEPFCIIEEAVEIGEDSFVGGHTKIRSGTKIGKRSVVGYGCSLEGNGIIIGNDVTIRSQSNIMWNMVIEDKVFISGGFYAANDSRIGKWLERQGGWKAEELRICYGARIGIGVLVGPNVRRIGRCALVGFGSNVTHDIPDYEEWYGNPAKKHRDIPEGERI